MKVRNGSDLILSPEFQRSFCVVPDIVHVPLPQAGGPGLVESKPLL
jgi:hypothetical protein